MSDYTQITNFTAKDALSSGDPEKIISGSDVDAEFDAISIAVQTKANKVTGSPVADLLAKLDSSGDLVASTLSESSLSGAISDISSLQSDVSTNTGNISTNTSDISDLQDATANVSRKNLIINGNFEIWQRGVIHYVGATGSPQTSGSGEYTADRWFAHAGVPSGGGTVTRQQFDEDGTDAVDKHTRYYFRYEHDGGDISTEGPFIYQRIENYAKFAGEQITISFWERTSAALPMSVTIAQSADGSTDAGSPTTFISTLVGSFTTSASASAFTKRTFTLTLPEVDTIQQYETVNNHLQLAINVVSSGSPTIQDGDMIDIAMVQVEHGPTATDYDALLLPDQWNLCQRYYQTSYQPDITPGTPAQNNDGHPHFYADSTNAAAGVLNWKVTMRTTPTVTLYRPSTGTAGVVELINESGLGGSPETSYVTNAEAGRHGFGLFQSGGLFTTGRMYQFHFTADAEL